MTGSLRRIDLRDAKEDLPLPGLDWVELRGDKLDHPVACAGKVASVAARPVRAELQFRNALFHDFDLRGGQDAQ